jgi:hypothetical protein
MLVIATIFGSNHIAARIAFDHGTNVITAVAARSAGTALVVLLLLLHSGISLRVERKTFGRSIVIGLLVAVQSYCLYSAVALIRRAPPINSIQATFHRVARCDACVMAIRTAKTTTCSTMVATISPKRPRSTASVAFRGASGPLAPGCSSARAMAV